MIISLEGLRMKLASSCCLFFLAGTLGAQTPTSSPAPPRPRYEVKRATSRIQVDGKLDEKARQAANPIVLILPWEFQTGAGGDFRKPNAYRVVA